MEQVSWQKEQKIAEYEAVKKAVADFMTYMNGKGTYQVFYDKQLEKLMYRSEEVVLPVSNLSAGYQSLIWMVFDIAYRMAMEYYRCIKKNIPKCTIYCNNTRTNFICIGKRCMGY